MSALLHGCWLVLVCLNLICVCVFVFVSLWSLCGISLFFSQYGGAIYNGGALTFEGSATFTSCSTEASSSYDVYAVSGGEWLLVEKPQPTTLSSQARSSDVGGQVVGGTGGK